jgi:3-phenylpropionate/trans-cinnamate dioxygenase ferredoxin reductase component
MSKTTTVIVGASIGGVRTAQALRGAGYAGGITLVSEETVPPYDKPPLSKGLLAGTTTVDDLALLGPTEAEDLGIDLQLGRRAAALHVADSELEFETGERLPYDNLVISTGARARPSPWGHPEGLHVLRTLADSQRLQADLQFGGRLVVVGGGFIGAEIAATARSMGISVTIVDPCPVPMERVVGHEIGERFTRLHQRHGVDTMFGVGVEGVAGHRGQFRVRMTDGHTLDADHVVVGIGAIPNDAWLASSGLEIDDGVVCDKFCRAVNAPNIYALGDVARWQNPRHDRLTRVEHWTNAIEQASVVAHNIVNPDDQNAYAPVEYVWSDQYDWKIRVAGVAGIAESRRVEVIGDDVDTGRFAALYSPDDQTLSGMVTVNWPRALKVARKALAVGTFYAEVKDQVEQLIGVRVAATAAARS